MRPSINPAAAETEDGGREHRQAGGKSCRLHRLASAGARVARAIAHIDRLAVADA
jgi:hypothetical protein